MLQGKHWALYNIWRFDTIATQRNLEVALLEEEGAQDHVRVENSAHALALLVRLSRRTSDNALEMSNGVIPASFAC